MWNVPVAVRLIGRVDFQALQASLPVLVQRHEILRTTLPAMAGEPMQRVAAP